MPRNGFPGRVLVPPSEVGLLPRRTLSFFSTSLWCTLTVRNTESNFRWSGTTMAKPRVSVVLSVFNGEKFLKEALDSIVNQSFCEFEFIVIDDHSSDGTAGILDAYTDRRIVRLRNDINRGPSYSFNRGLKIAQGEYVAKMDADDRSLPTRLAEQVAFLDLQESVGLVGAQVKLIDEGGNILGEWQYPTDPLLIHWALQFYNPICHPVVMYRRALVNQLGGYATNCRWAEDYDLWIRLSKKAEIAQLPLALLEYRLHGGQITQERFAEMEKSAAAIVRQNINAFWNDPGISDGLIFALRQILGVYPENTRPVSERAIVLLIQLGKAYCRKKELNRKEIRKIEAQLANALMRFGGRGADELSAYALRQSNRLTSNHFLHKYFLKKNRFR